MLVQACLLSYQQLEIRFAPQSSVLENEQEFMIHYCSMPNCKGGGIQVILLSELNDLEGYFSKICSLTPLQLGT